MPLDKEKQGEKLAPQAANVTGPAQVPALDKKAAAAAWAGYVKDLRAGGPAAAPAQGKAAGGSAGAVQNTPAWGDEVHGIPANAQARPDDDAQIVSTETTEKKNKVALEKGTGKFDRTSTVKTKEGDIARTAETTTGVALSKKGVDLSRSKSEETGVGEDMSMKSTRTMGVSANLEGASVKRGRETEATVGDTKITSGRDVSVGFSKGKLEAERVATQKREDEHGSQSNSKSIGIADGKVKRGFSDEKETKRKVQETRDDGTTHEVEKTSKRGTDTSVSIGTDGAAAERSWSKTNERGTKSSTTVGAEVDDKGNASVNAGHQVTSKGGTSVKVSAKAGVEVHASEPVQRGDRWVVTYKRTKSLGGAAGGGAKGMSVQADVTQSGFETGTRSFASQKEAEDFREHAAERIVDSADPTTAAGALSLAEGESRGKGGAVQGTLGGSATLEGATIGVSGSKKKSEEVSVRKVSGTIVEATYKKSTDRSAEIEGGGMGVTTGAGRSSGESDTVTVRFDLGTPEGQAAFEQFAQNHEIPAKAGKVVSRGKAKKKESHDGTRIAGLGDARWEGGTAEDTTVDEGGKHETYEGHNSQEVNPTRLARWTGDKQKNSSIEIAARQENDKDAGYSVEGRFSGESGTHNRAKMRNLMGVEENFDEGKVEGKASGEWTMSADIDRKTMAAEHKYNKRYRGLKSNDDRMRATAQAVAEKGAGAIESIESMGDKKLDWDVALKGDKNFPGREGRVALEAKVRKLGQTLSKTPGSAPSVLSEVETERAALQARRAAVADPKRYLDLPDALRKQQLGKIDADLAKLEALRHQAAIESTKNKPGEKIGDIQQRHYVTKKYPGMSGAQLEVAQARDGLAETDDGIRRYDEKNREARAALIHAANHHTDFSKANSTYVKRKEAGFKAGNAIADVHEKQYKALDDLRASLLRSAQDPKAALPLAQSLSTQLRAQLDLAGAAWAQYEQAAIAQVNMNKAGNLGRFQSFWDDIVANSMDASDFTPPEETREADAGREAETSPPPKVSMALPPRKGRK